MSTTRKKPKPKQVPAGFAVLYDGKHPCWLNTSHERRGQLSTALQPKAVALFATRKRARTAIERTVKVGGASELFSTPVAAQYTVVPVYQQGAAGAQATTALEVCAALLRGKRKPSPADTTVLQYITKVLGLQ